MKGGTAAAVRKRKKTNSIAATDSKPTFSHDSAAGERVDAGGGGGEGMAFHSKKLSQAIEFRNHCGFPVAEQSYHFISPSSHRTTHNTECTICAWNNHAYESETGARGMQAAFPNPS